MNGLDRVIPEPDLVEIDHVDVAASPERTWSVARRGNLVRTPLTRALFSIRTLPSRLRGRKEPVALTLDDIVSSDRPGFRLLAETDREVVVGAIGKVWKVVIPFVEVQSTEQFAGFSAPGYAKVAWALRVRSRGENEARIELELRVSGTDSASRDRFRRYFRLIGPGSHFIRREALASIAQELGTPEAVENERPLPGDDLLPDAAAQVTHGITIRAKAASIWPWLVQMGCRRAGWYSYDFLDNARIESAKEIHPELQQIAVGDVLPSTPQGEDGFEVLRLDPSRVLVLGGLFDPEAKKQLPFGGERPARYWHVSWAFVLETFGEDETRLLVRVRGAFPEGGRLHFRWIRLVHHFMQTAQLRNLKARAEARLPRHGWRDVASGVVGAAGMALNLLTPFLGGARSHWGLDEVTASREYPGDDLVSEPRWSWTHGVEIDAPREKVWPWVSQIGADRAGFYSYQWLENVAGCNVRNVGTVHPEWEVQDGDRLVLHPDMPAMPIVALEPGRYFVAHDSTEEKAGAASRSWVSVSWLFLVEPLPEDRSRFISRFRSACSDDVATRLAYGPYITESVGFVMDRRMLLGVKERVERRLKEEVARPPLR